MRYWPRRRERQRGAETIAGGAAAEHGAPVPAHHGDRPAGGAGGGGRAAATGPSSGSAGTISDPSPGMRSAIASAPAASAPASMSGLPTAAKSWTQSRTAGATRPRRTASTGARAMRRPSVAPNGGDPDAAVEMIDRREQHAGMEEDVLLGAATGKAPPFLDEGGGLGRGKQRNAGLVATAQRHAALDPPVGDRRRMEACHAHGTRHRTGRGDDRRRNAHATNSDTNRSAALIASWCGTEPTPPRLCSSICDDSLTI